MSVVDVVMPNLGESVEQGLVNRWLKAPGDSVEQYEPLVEVTTDKVNVEVPADYVGVVREILVQEGQMVSVGTVICRLEVSQE